jgi:hypothetical protein
MTLLGTPFRLHGRSPDIGLDCVGVVAACLFEAGYQIQEVSMVSGHSSWEHLKRYTNLRPETLHR